MRLRFLLLVILSCGLINSAFAMEKAVYMLRGDATDTITTYERQLQSCKANIKTINIIMPQAYQIDARGGLWGGVDPVLLNYAREHQVKVMPMVTDADFDETVLKKFLSDVDAQNRALQYMTDACKKYHYYGYQIDFEHVPISQSAAFTQFYQLAAKTLHDNHCAISVAIIPRVSDDPGDSFYLKSKFENWSGAYDYKNLGASSDFVTLMAYEQHGSITTPGPIAGVPWVEQITKYALKYIPASKISLGIAVNSAHWYTSETSEGIKSKSEDIAYDAVQQLLNKFSAPLLWDPKQKVNYSMYNYNQLNEYIFIENQKSLAEKIALIKKYHLRGISVWRLGVEDPKIWSLLSRS